MAYDVTYKRLALSALFDLKGSSKDIWKRSGEYLPARPEKHNSRGVDGTRQIWFIGPDHWILRDDLSQEEALETALKPAEAPSNISIVKISDTLAFYEVVGADADQIMAIACPMDLHPLAFGYNDVSYSDVFGLRAIIMRRDDGFEFAVEQSFGTMIEDYLQRALR